MRVRIFFNWAKFIKVQLCELGMPDLWYGQGNLIFKVHFPLIKQGIIDSYIHVFQSSMSVSSKCFLYRHIVDNFSLQYYLCKRIPNIYKKQLAKIRLSSHQLSIESGRHQNIARHERLCPICNSELEDEYHFILICHAYSDLRKKYIKRFYWNRPSVFKLVQLLSVHNIKILCNLGKFIKSAFELRKELISLR